MKNIDYKTYSAQLETLISQIKNDMPIDIEFQRFDADKRIYIGGVKILQDFDVLLTDVINFIISALNRYETNNNEVFDRFGASDEKMKLKTSLSVKGAMTDERNILFFKKLLKSDFNVFKITAIKSNVETKYEASFKIYKTERDIDIFPNPELTKLLKSMIRNVILPSIAEEKTDLKLEYQNGLQRNSCGEIVW